MNLTVIGAVAVTTAVLTGALLVGDSVRGSLRRLTLERLGKINYALHSDRFFHQELGKEAAGAETSAAILLQGTATLDTRRATNIQINAIDSTFLSLFDAIDLQTNFNGTGAFPPVIINESLARELKAVSGDEILLSYSKPAEIHRETILGNRDVTEVVQRNRFKVTAVIADEKMGRFSLNPNQHLPLNAFVPLQRLQRLLRQPGEVNALFFSGDRVPTLKPHMKLQDFGLRFVGYANELSLESDEVVLKPAIVHAATETAKSLHLQFFPVLTYLANKISYKDRIVPYSTVTAVNPPVPFLDPTGQPIRSVEPDEILLNQWTATDLDVQPGEKVELTYYVLGEDSQLTTRTTPFRLKAVVQQIGLAEDPNLAPRYPGIEDATDMSDWSPPFPVDLNLIRPQDEDYWDNYRATPKAFIAQKTGEDIWSSRFGTYTSVRFFGRSKTAITKELLARLNPAEMNFNIREVKAEGLRAAEGATDFAALFVGFSMFLIGSAVLLVGLLFRLNIDQRKKEVGVLLATGLRIKEVQKRLLLEGAMLALAGGMIGTALAAFYAWLMITALQSWWITAVGASFLFLHAAPASLVTGLLISVVISFLTILFSVRALSRHSVVSLLKGFSTVPDGSRAARWSGKVAVLMFLIAAGLSFGAFTTESAVLFFTGGASLLIACLALFAFWLRAAKSSLQPRFGLISSLKIAVRNTVRNPGRSLLSVCLVAAACFVIVAVGSNRRSSESNWQQKNSGTGGFGIVASSAVPIYENLQTSLASYGLRPDETRIFGFRLLAGDDASCLNLYQTEKPRVLGVPQDFINRGGFTFQETIAEAENPWNLLTGKTSDVIPAIGDYNSVRWILHKKLGEDIALVDDHGKTVRLRLVALLKSSLLQSELLISEENFIAHFPRQGGRSYFLIEAGPQKRESVLQNLETNLHFYGFDAVRAEEKLAAYHAVENTYLSTFQTLGALGLLLGTLGLGIILIRNVIERRGELATMRAFGYRRKTLGWFVLLENAFLLIVGIAAGCIAAAISILPHILSQSPDVPWVSLGLTLVLVFTVGLTASLAAIALTLKIPLLPALKAENS